MFFSIIKFNYLNKIVMVKYMNLKKVKVISLFGVFLISFLSHFMYEWFPCIVSSIFFPVNESIWEHMKIFTSSILLYSTIEYLILKKKNIYYNNFLLSTVVTSIISVPLYLVIYLPLYSIFGENMFISIGLMFIVYVIIEYISYKILLYRELNVNKYVLLTILVIVYIMYTYLTYKPIKNYIFYDIKEKKYGITT